jgi:DNA-binding NarL/FixJ family response regulator
MYGAGDDRGLSPEAEVDETGMTVVISDREVIAHGLVGLLPQPWRAPATILSDAAALEELAVPMRAVIVDAEMVDAPQIAALAVSRGAVLIVLLGSAADDLDPVLLGHADAILVHDEVDPRTLQLAVTAAALGMRLLPRGLSSTNPGGADVRRPGALGEPAQRALELLAGGLRDAEIARELNLSESAARKVIQRAVRHLGARTRSQAVAIAVRAGEL